MLGQTLGHYRIVEKIGAGGMGEVYRARDEHLGRDVAIKVLPPGTLADEHARKRFRKEALALSKLNHPNIATVHDFDTQNGVDFLVMELVEGVTLSDKLAAGALPEKEIARLGGQLAEGLAAAHERRVVHRDLKPANLRVTPDGRLKILDFGLAKLVRPDVASATATTESFTETQAVAGTLPYMAPEQVRAENVDARSDIYAAGAVLYEMATGQRAFPETQAGRLMDAILHQAPQPPSGLNRRVSVELERIILKCLEKEPEDRYQAAKEVEVDLRRLKRDTDSGRAAVAGAGGLRAATKKRWKVLAPVAALVAVLAGAAVWHFRSAQALAETDYILLTDFVNTTGDPVFDGTLKQALAVKLEESPYLNIFPERRVEETLRLMERAPDEPVTQAIGQEICERQGIKGMVLGEISPLGSHYVISLNAVNCQIGDSLAREQVEAARKEEVLGALGQATSSLRKTLGESLSSIEEFDTPLEEATTSSLEALKVYTLGREQVRRGREAQSIPFFQRAIELDQDFAMAYGAIGTRYWNLGEMEKAAFYWTRAFELQERASEFEKLRITSLYYGATGETGKEKETYEVQKKLYQRDWASWNDLAILYYNTGQYDKAADEARQAIQLAPDKAYPYLNLGIAYLGLNRFTDAKAVSQESIARKFEDEINRLCLWQIAFLEEDTASMRRHADWANGKPDEYMMLQRRADGAAFFGKMQEARELRRQGVESALRHEFKEVAASLTALGALIEAEVGNHEKASEDAEAALAISRALRVEIPAAQVLALSNKIGPAQALADDLGARFPADTLLHAVSLPLIRARIQSQRGNPEQAIELLRAAAPYELGSQYDLHRDITFSAIYARGRAYLQARSGLEAANEFQKILDHRGVDITCPLYALAHLGLARAYALSGDTTNARKKYEDFLTLWKDADPDIPILQEAKAEYAKLR